MDERSRDDRDAEPDTRGGLGGGTTSDPSDQAGDIGNALGHDLGNLGDTVPAGGDQTFPSTPVSENTM